MDFNWDDAKSGATVGAVAGTAVEPGLGTAVGAVGGGLIGGFGGFGGGLWGDMSGQTSSTSRYGSTKQLGQKMAGNEQVLQDWAYHPEGRKDQYGTQLTPAAPSAAQDLLARNRSEGQQRSLSNAKALSGGNAALAGTMANRQQAQVSADSGLQAATLRAQEQQNAMAAYQAAMERRRQQEIDVSKAQMDNDAKNSEKNSSFIGSLMGGAGNVMGGMF